ncbi:hypothetical protein K3725_15555 [Leisingera sp. S132]|uniref:hypothetical protein n=1 Tax=Leisingera sp. S132 TaxID=2867016 RepID=UPI0021A74021|nr:hypothetical protein [Leisingera sp. S132]UWQ78710.1 hypothetical protein K3725_15555 [Leisingera sp. S132]
MELDLNRLLMSGFSLLFLAERIGGSKSQKRPLGGAAANIPYPPDVSKSNARCGAGFSDAASPDFHYNKQD